MKKIEYRYPGGKMKALTMSYDDGTIHDRRLVEIFNRHGIKGTFHLNSGTFMYDSKINTDEIATLFAGHEVSCHTFTHPFVERVPDMEVVNQILLDKQTLEDICGYVVRGMSYPFGSRDTRSVEILRTLGMRYSRTTASTGSFGLPDDFMLWNPTCHHKGGIMDKLEAFKNNKYPLSLFYVWGHSYEFNNDNNWELIEGFCAAAEGMEDVWYATNIEICDYITALRHCEMSADRSILYNPSATSVWVIVDGNLIECKGGEHTKLF